MVDISVYDDFLREFVLTMGKVQIVKAAEEMAEFSAALLKHYIEGTDRSFDRLLEEYADAVIMIRQMEILLGIDRYGKSGIDLAVARLKDRARRIEEGVCDERR